MEPHAGAPEPVVLILADISGYTRYMTANVKTLAHSQTIITELVKAIVKQVELPLEVAKLEGDAVFLFGRKGPGVESWSEKKKLVGQKLFTFFDTFSKKAHELSYSATCTCNACTHIEKLRLKLIVHSGEALFHQVLNFQELAGVDVIIVHRLLKNSTQADQYLLMTEAAQSDVELPNHVRLVQGIETYQDIGQITTGVYYPDGLPTPVSTAAPMESGFFDRFSTVWGFFLKLWFKPVVSVFAADRPEFHHLASSSTNARQLAWALLTLLLTPIYLPIGTMLVLFRALHSPETT